MSALPIEDLIIRKREQIELLLEEKSRLKCEVSFHEFVKQAWKQVEGKRPFVDGWHIQAICEHLEAVTYGDIRYLLINIPPGCCKSTLVSVLWPVWTWIARPEIRFICASYAASLSIRDAIKARRVIQSPWFQQRWGHIFRLTKNTEDRYENDQKGYRISTSVDGTSTGEGGDILVTDDLNNVKDTGSEAIREKTRRFWTQVWPTRMRDDTNGAMVNIQQRIDMLDTTSMILEGEDADDWVKLILPMEFESDRRSKTISLPSTKNKIWQDPRKKDGELLWPEFKNAKAVAKLKKQLRDKYVIAGQLQQRPAPEEGGIIQKAWFRWWKKTAPPKIIQIIQSWDTALEDKRSSDFSACTTWGLFYEGNNQPNIMLLGMWRGQVEYPDLHAMAKRLYKDYRDTGLVEVKPDPGKYTPDFVIVEAKVSGISLRQNLRRAGINAIGFDPTKYGDKIQRVKIITHFIEAGRIWVPARPPNFTTLRTFANEVVDLAGLFPNGDSRDVIDTMTQLLLRLSQTGWLTHPDDEGMEDTSMKPKNLPKWGE